MAVVALVLLLVGWFVAQQERAERFRISEDFVERESPWNHRRRRFSWGAVRKIGYPMHQTLVLFDDRGRLMRIGPGIDGIGDFAAVALRRLPPEVLGKAPDVKALLTKIAGLLPLDAGAAGTR